MNQVNEEHDEHATSAELPGEREQDDLARRYAELKARRAREAEAEQDDLERRAMRRAVEAAQPFDEAADKYGRGNVELVDTKAGWIILKKPHPANYRKFSDVEKTTTEDVERLVRPSVVAASDVDGTPAATPVDAFERICKELPATLLYCGTVVAKLGGAEVHAQGKK